MFRLYIPAIFLRSPFWRPPLESYISGSKHQGWGVQRADTEESKMILIEGAGDFVTTYNWGYNPTYSPPNWP